MKNFICNLIYYSHKLLKDKSPQKSSSSFSNQIIIPAPVVSKSMLTFIKAIFTFSTDYMTDWILILIFSKNKFVYVFFFTRKFITLFFTISFLTRSFLVKFLIESLSFSFFTYKVCSQIFFQNVCGFLFFFLLYYDYITY